MSEKNNPTLLDALENERRYIAKELHDGVAQTTLQLGLQAGICRKLLERNQLELLLNELGQLEERSQKASGQLREIIQDLRPPMLETDEDSTLNDYITYAITLHHRRGGAPVAYQYKIQADDDLRLTPAQMLGLMRIVQEGLLNTRKHAIANSVRLTVTMEPGTLYLTIADDGRGFDPAEVASRLVDRGGVGLDNLLMRAQAVGGSLNVARDTTGSGTKIMVVLSV